MVQRMRRGRQSEEQRMKLEQGNSHGALPPQPRIHRKRGDTPGLKVIKLPYPCLQGFFECDPEVFENIPITHGNHKPLQWPQKLSEFTTSGILAVRIRAVKQPNHRAVYVMCGVRGVGTSATILLFGPFVQNREDGKVPGDRLQAPLLSRRDKGGRHSPPDVCLRRLAELKCFRCCAGRSPWPALLRVLPNGGSRRRPKEKGSRFRVERNPM